MATPIREKILEALKTKLSGLAAFNGNTAQRANSELDIDNLPAISLWDGSDAIVGTDQRATARSRWKPRWASRPCTRPLPITAPGPPRPTRYSPR